MQATQDTYIGKNHGIYIDDELVGKFTENSSDEHECAEPVPCNWFGQIGSFNFSILNFFKVGNISFRLDLSETEIIALLILFKFIF